MISFPFRDSTKENFLVLEVSQTGTRGMLLSIDRERTLKLVKWWDDFSWSKMSRHFRQRLQKWNVIVSASSSLALTTLIPVKLEREKEYASQPISALELENLLAQTTAKIFNQCRSEASRALGIDELHTILIDNRVVSFRLDGHQVVNPVDFKAKKIDAILELTLTTREIFEDWKDFFNIGQNHNFFFTESARSELMALKKIKPMPINLLTLDSDTAACFVLEPAAVKTMIRRTPLNWSLNSLTGAIEGAWGIDSKTAQQLYFKYLNKETSPKISRYFSTLFQPILSALLSELAKAQVKGPVFMDSTLPLPFVLPKHHSRFTLNDMPLSNLVDKLGLKIDFTDWPLPPSQLFRRLSPFFEFYYNNDKESSINHWLRRRLHWLGSPV